MNADDWKTLAIPGEFDAMDATDQGRWRGVIEQAYNAGRGSLLAAVEDGDEIVRELSEPRWNRDTESNEEPTELERKAAARITLDAQEKAALKGELASVKAHADAMAEALDYGENFGAYSDLTDAYRAAHPKEGA